MDSLSLKHNNPITLCHCSSGVSWSVETSGVLLINSITGNTQFLDYPEAALWDFLSREYSWKKIIIMLASINGTGLEETETIVATTIDSWIKDGWLTRGIRDG